jgi:hypothetical protein
MIERERLDIDGLDTSDRSRDVFAIFEGGTGAGPSQAGVLCPGRLLEGQVLAIGAVGQVSDRLGKVSLDLAFLDIAGPLGLGKVSFRLGMRQIRDGGCKVSLGLHEVCLSSGLQFGTSGPVGLLPCDVIVSIVSVVGHLEVSVVVGAT